MKDANEPYWHTNKKWWRFNEDGEYVLTPEAPEEARKSFEEYFKEEEPDEEGYYTS